MRSLVYPGVLFLALAAQAAPALPKVLFFGNPMGSDNHVVRRAQPDQLSVAERHFAELSKGLFDVTITQNGADVSRENLERYRAVVFFTAINPPGVDQDALVEWVKKGGAFTGIHSTANTYQKSPAFGHMLGANFDRRPWRTPKMHQTTARIKVVDRSHPATRHFPASFEIAEDLYQYKNFDPSKVQLLLSMDPSSLDRAVPKFNHQDRILPVAWVKSHGEGRVFYTMLGDWEPTWKMPAYRTHLIEGIRWTMRMNE